jgi:hypothetical protein
METSKEVIDELSKILDATPKNLNRKTMTPKEKANEIFDKMYEADFVNDDYPMCFETARQCSIIAVGELISQENSYNNGSFYPSNYWKEVKQEIEKL